MNWQSLIADIQRLGDMSQAQIASACGCAQATVSDLAKGVTMNPRFELGQALVALRKTVSRRPAKVGA